MVLVPASSSEGTGLSTYYVRVKDGSIADTLAKTLQERKVLHSRHRFISNNTSAS
jgi:hypothetical protein